VSGLRLSEIAPEPVVSSDSVTDNTVTERSDVSETADKSEIDRLSRASDFSTPSDTRRLGAEVVDTKRPSVVTETVTAAETETSAGNTRPVAAASEARSQPAGIINQSSLPEQMSIDKREDKDLSATVSSFCFSFVILTLWLCCEKVFCMLADHLCIRLTGSNSQGS